MNSLPEQLIEHGLRNKVFSERQLGRVTGGGSARRYGLVNRALKAHELIRLQRGLYILPAKYRTEDPHPFALAQALEPGSYVSVETSLSAHGWIPERVQVVASVIPGRKSASLEHPSLGTFTFHPLAHHKTHYLELIERRQWGTQVGLIAHPLRALLDLITLRKLEWQGLQWLTESLRIEETMLHTITPTHIRAIAGVYKHKRSNHFLQELARELRL
jgi:hypothetical protein